MQFLTVIWPMIAASCLTLGGMQLLIWVRDRERKAHLLFACTALGAAIVAISELLVFKAGSIAAYKLGLWWNNVGVFVMLVSLVWFVYQYFGTARRWLALLITASWTVGLVVNVLAWPDSLTYTSIIELEQVALPWGEMQTFGNGEENPWKYVVDFTSLLVLIYLADASIRLWRQGGRKRAVNVGGSTVVFILLAGGITPLLDAGVIVLPSVISIMFLGIVAAVSFELSGDVVRAGQLSKEVAANELRWRSLLQDVQLIVVGLNNQGQVTYVNPYFTLVTGFDSAEALGRDWFAHFSPQEEASAVRVHFLTSIREQKLDIPYFENAILTNDGQQRTIRWSNVLQRDNEGKVIGSLSVGADVTERRAAEQDRDKALAELTRALEEVETLKHRLEAENLYLKEEIGAVKNPSNMIGESDVLRYVLRKIENVAPTDATVLIEGETGVGKELVARAIHQASLRAEAPFITINCAALPTQLIESELFGHEKGAFTGALVQRRGRFELADGGTLLLDEVGELPLELQANLLRVLQDGTFERVGGSETLTVDVRILTATNRDLNEEVAQGRFRGDLFYRLDVYPITVPPLRARRSDIPLLVRYFVDETSRRMGKQIEEVPGGIMQLLEAYPWPGNVRELHNVIERAVITSQGPVLQLPTELRLEGTAPVGSGGNGQTTEILTLEEVERQHIRAVLESTGWRISGPQGAARLLDLNPSTLRFRMKKLGISKE